ncbi:hypothetical protein [Brachybacterium hainanense]|uniref:Uncharacterized protein n=1 Tax=Brachybacterium hainanense TaxID=1541174 RepID=A0ABV6RCL5_9MICO
MIPALPRPDGGWPHLLRQVVAVVLLWAIAAFLIAAAGLPLMDPQCYSDSPSGGEVCPLDPDPVLTHLFDARWPAVPEPVTVTVSLAAVFAGIGLAIHLDTSEPWSERGDAPTAAGLIAGVLGAGLGLLIAGPGFLDPRVAIGITALGALLLLLGLLALRAFLRALRRRYARHLRREHLRGRGTRTIATITGLVWTERYRRYGGQEDDGDPIFAVTARLGRASGARTVAEELAVPRADAPVVGGTVIVIHDDEHAHETGIDVLLEPDPDGLRDPDALVKYPPAPESSPS